MSSLLRPFLEIQLRDVIDIAVVTVLLWAGLVWLRRTRARLALLGVAIVGVVYLLAKQLDLQLTAWLLQGFFAVFVIVVVVVFQDDLRRLFEQIAVWGLRRRPPIAPPDMVDTLVRSCARLAAGRTGALIVLPGREPLDRHVDGGIALEGRVSEPLLLSLFDPHSPGHDGAILILGDRIARFATHLPLSHEQTQLGPRGTRHAAALGLAERTDALCIVVSEERGTVSVARGGILRTLPRPEQLGAEVRRFQEETAPERTARRAGWREVLRRWPEALISIGLALGFWFLVVPGSSRIEKTRSATVVVENLPKGYKVESVNPPKVDVRVEGRRRDLLLLDSNALQVRVDALLVELGRRTFEINSGDVEHPKSLTILDVHPNQVRLSIVKEAPKAKAAPKS